MHDSQGSTRAVAGSEFPHQTDSTLTSREAATFLASSPRTLESWRRKGTGPAFIRQGRSIRYRLTDLISFQEANRIEPEGGA